MMAASRILIVDDEAPIRGLLSHTFERAGYVVKTAVSGRDAIALCGREEFDFVLSDVVMPEMDGHELVRWLATHRPATHFALMSGYDPGDAGVANTPLCDLIPKPFKPVQVLDFVQLALKS